MSFIKNEVFHNLYRYKTSPCVKPDKRTAEKKWMNLKND